MKIFPGGILILSFLFFKANAQHTHSERHLTDTILSPVLDSLSEMTHAFSPRLPMNRNGSGTAWMPDETPVYGYMYHGDLWNFMFHGNLFLRYIHQDIFNKGQRGGKTLDAPNWMMGMLQWRSGVRGLFIFKTMFSLDPLTEGKNGYPLLFQTGESLNGKPLIDRQHNHDLFSEIALGYTQSINKNTDLSIYAGYPGEPALGPTFFMHRVSSYNNPDAPIGHHWQDATHITFGVATLGLRYYKFKFEGSGFNGREPDENRYNFDKLRFDSYSYRVSYNPNAFFSLQFSQGYLKSPEALEPEINLIRSTVSAHFSKLVVDDRHITSSVVYGVNKPTKERAEQSLLGEVDLQLSRAAFYARYEIVQKTSTTLGLVAFRENKIFHINVATLGTNYSLLKYLHTNVKVGLQGSFYLFNKDLRPVYGKYPVSTSVYFRISPGLL